MTISEFFARLGQRIWSTKQTLRLVRPAGKPLPEVTWKQHRVDLREATPDMLEDCAAFENAEHYVPIYRAMLERGDIVHFGYMDGKCVYRHAAQCSGEVTWEGCVIYRLQEKEIRTHFSYCAPEARGKGWQTESLRKMFLARFDSAAYTEVLPDNTGSLICCYRAGYEVYSLVTVKNRLFRRSVTEQILTPEERKQYDI